MTFTFQDANSAPSNELIQKTLQPCVWAFQSSSSAGFPHVSHTLPTRFPHVSCRESWGERLPRPLPPGLGGSRLRRWKLEAMLNCSQLWAEMMPPGLCRLLLGHGEGRQWPPLLWKMWTSLERDHTHICCFSGWSGRPLKVVQGKQIPIQTYPDNDYVYIYILYYI